MQPRIINPSSEIGQDISKLLSPELWVRVDDLVFALDNRYKRSEIYYWLQNHRKKGELIEEERGVFLLEEENGETQVKAVYYHKYAISRKHFRVAEGVFFPPAITTLMNNNHN